MAEAGDEHRDVDVGDGLRLHVRLSGAGAPLVLLHGFTGSGATWDPLRAALDRRHRVATVDLPGHGRSGAPDDPARYALDRFADDLVRVLDVLDMRCVALLGYSMGGRAALRVALRHPGRVQSLVLESTSPGIGDPAQRASRLAADRALAARIERDGVTAFVHDWERLPMWESQRGMPDVTRAALRAQREANVAGGLANSLRGAGSGVDTPVLDRLGDLRAPTLVLAGALDAPYVAHADEMARRLPASTLAIVPDAGHAVHLERPSAFAAAVSAFLRPV